MNIYFFDFYDLKNCKITNPVTQHAMTGYTGKQDVLL